MDEATQYYLKARELHLLFTPSANARARALFQKAIDLNPDFHRAKGHLAYSSIHAWLYGWDDIDLKDVMKLAWGALYEKEYPDDTAQHAGANDYDNWWSVGVALLYYAAREASSIERDTTFVRSLKHYEEAWIRASKSPEAVAEDMADLLADYAEALYFGGDSGDINRALVLLDDAKKRSAASHPNWHDWNRAWAHYELGHQLEQSKPAESEMAYLTAIDLLTDVPNLPNQYRRTLAVCYAALGWNDDARREGRQFLRHERSRGRPYDPAIESRWPYKDRDKHKKLRERLRKAGFRASL